MNLLVSVAVKIVPEEKEILAPVAHAAAVASEEAVILSSEVQVEEVLAAETEEELTSELSLSPTPTETPSPTPTEIVLTETPTVTPTSTIQPTTTPTITPSLTTTPTPTITTIPVAAPVNLDELFARYSGQYGVDVNLLKKIAKCESNFNTNAIGPKGLYVGMFQFGDGSWQSTRKQMGLDPNPQLRTNAEESIKTAAFAISKGRASMWPHCSI